MNTGSIVYSAKTSGLSVDEFTVQSDHKNIESFVCSVSKAGGVRLEVMLKDIYAEEWPCAEIAEETGRFLSMFSFEFDCPIYSVRENGYTIRKKDSDMKAVSSSLVFLWDIASAEVTPGSNSLHRFRQRLKTFVNSGLARLYAAAIQQEDPIARYMFLYNIVLTINVDKQEVVDQRIMSIDATTPQTSSPWRSAVKETVYTRLRNQVAHKRSGADLETTSKEIRKWESSFRSITKKLIIQEG
jgi:hypothetical protein